MDIHVGKRILRHAAWYLYIAYHRKEIGEAFDVLMNLAL